MNVLVKDEPRSNLPPLAGTLAQREGRPLARPQTAPRPGNRLLLLQKQEAVACRAPRAGGWRERAAQRPAVVVECVRWELGAHTGGSDSSGCAIAKVSHGLFSSGASTARALFIFKIKASHQTLASCPSFSFVCLCKNTSTTTSYCT